MIISARPESLEMLRISQNKIGCWAFFVGESDLIRRDCDLGGGWGPGGLEPPDWMLRHASRAEEGMIPLPQEYAAWVARAYYMPLLGALASQAATLML